MHEKSYAAKGIATFHGHARFTGRNSVAVEGIELGARHILIATGATPVTLGIPGEEHLIANEEFLALKTLPKRIFMVGGGYIAAEFSHVAARAGAEVTVLQRSERMLTHFDADLVGWLMEKFTTVGIAVRTGTAVEAIEKVGGGYHVTASAAGQERRTAGVERLSAKPSNAANLVRRHNDPNSHSVRCSAFRAAG